ncbi:MAG: M42 family metallopeptidase [Oscillospiraceae bacterium]|nr:M42 family metallopeptidase [Oscillospiraceae bacterium]
MLIKHLENLCLLCGASGNETSVRDYIYNNALDYKNSMTIDPLGSLIIEKKGIKSSPKKLMISAHMDEVGLIITYINDDGTMQIAPVGGIEPSVVIGRPVVVGNDNINGVIGAKPIHLLSNEQRQKLPSFSELYLDIGAKSREEAESIVSPGTYVHFLPGFDRMGSTRIRSKALDDRIGCAIMLQLLSEQLPYDVTFAFLVQEEVGLRGAKAAAYSVNPDVCIVLEATTAADLAGADEDSRVCSLGKGPVVPFMDRSTIYDKKLYDAAFSECRRLGIPCQTKTRIAGGNDSGAIHVSRGGVRTVSVSAPCRYLHSPSCVADIADIENCCKLTRAMIEKAVEI